MTQHKTRTILHKDLENEPQQDIRTHGINITPRIAGFAGIRHTYRRLRLSNNTLHT